MGGRIYYLTARQILARSSDLKTVQAVYDKLAINHIHGMKLKDGPQYLVYPVDDDFFRTKEDITKEWMDKGYVSVDMLAERFCVSKPTVCKKICDAGLVPDGMDSKRRRWWKDGLWTWNLFHVAPPAEVLAKYTDGSPVPVREPRVRPSKRKDRKVRFGDPEVDAILDMEEEKKKWIGEKGRIIVRGKVAVEGIIESVSSCGVYIKGSNVRGNINELELCKTPGERVEDSGLPDEG